MRLLNLFSWMYFGQDNRALQEYVNDQQRYDAVQNFFNSLDGAFGMLLLVCIIVPILMCVIYHWPFNKKSGRHYRPVFQLWAALFSLAVTFLITFVLVAVTVKTPSFDSGLNIFKVLMAFGCGVDSMVVYLIAALVIGAAFKTNAFPIHKIFSKNK
ncbi:MAG: hypothetical protein K5867_04555 [Bacteroidales bacterium]|nr:hypothetical protein [Bacteroidales bacterium]